MHSSLLLTRTVTSLRTPFTGPTRGKVAMFHVGRCGSTVLARALKGHSQISWGDELFDQVTSKYPGFRPGRDWVHAVIDAAVHRRRCGYFGFETKPMHIGPHCIPIPIEDYVTLLLEMGFRSFIVLTRSNLLRALVSGIIGTTTGRLHVAAGASEPTSVTIDPEMPFGSWAPSLVGILESYERFYAQFDVTLRDRKRLDLNYERDILPDPMIAYREVCKFLDVEVEPSNVSLGRTNPFPLDRMVANFEDISTALRGTRFEWMLTAP